MSATSPDIGADAAWPTEATGRMNRMYRWQRHIYDLTRRYYLLGRDRLIARLEPAAGATVLEIGCGTGRNLVHAAMLYPDAQFFGIDVSTEMLTTAISAIARAGLTVRIRVAHGDANALDPARSFGIPQFDHVMISYSLSMIPDWRVVLRAATNHIKPGGCLHVVDFGRQEGLPAIARILLRQWLKLFDVAPRDGLEHELSALAEGTGAKLTFQKPFRGYAQYGVVAFPAETRSP